MLLILGTNDLNYKKGINQKAESYLQKLYKLPPERIYTQDHSIPCLFSLKSLKRY